MYSYDAHSAWLCQFKMLYFLIGERLFFFPSSFHSCFKKKEVTGDGWKGSVQTAKSSRPTEPLQLFFFKVPPLCLPLLLSSPLRFWSVVVPFRMVFFFFLVLSSFQGMEQYPPHALPPPCSCSPRRSFWPWFSLSQSPGVCRIFSTSSSKAHCTPSLVFALASVQRKKSYQDLWD